MQAEGQVTKTGRPFDKGSIAKLLANRVYLGEAVHKGQSFPDEHDAIVTAELWDRVQAILQEGPRGRGGLPVPRPLPCCAACYSAQTAGQ